jgi:hypothetical protein
VTGSQCAWAVATLSDHDDDPQLVEIVCFFWRDQEPSRQRASGKGQRHADRADRLAVRLSAIAKAYGAQVSDWHAFMADWAVVCGWKDPKEIVTGLDRGGSSG